VADFKKLRVWRKAHGQSNRAAMSIPTNIVEGRAKNSDRDFARYLGYALGSATELEYHITLARDVGAMSESDFNSLMRQVVDIKRMLHGLIERLSAQ
jgi:four helix bundle protein